MMKEGPFGHSLFLRAVQKIEDVKKKNEDHFTWVKESLAEAQRTFTSPDIQLLPKTPSVKRTRQMRKGDSEEDDLETSKRPKRTRKNKKVDESDSEAGVDSGSSARSTRSTRTTRSSRATRATRAQQLKDDEVVTVSPIMRMVPANLSKLDEELVCASPANSVSVIAKEPTTEEHPTPKPRTPSKVKGACSPASSPAKPAKPSPKPIPGFTGLNVKAKATAYEEFVASPQKGSYVASADECSSPRQRNALCRVLDSLRRSNSPRKQVSPVKAIQSPDLKSKNNRGTITISETEVSPIEIDNSDEPDTVPVVEEKSSRRSSKRLSHVVSKPSAVRTSLSQRRSSIMRHKLRLSTTKLGHSASKLNRSSSIRRTPSKSRKPTPAPITLGDGPVTPSIKQPDFTSDEETQSRAKTPKSTKKTEKIMRNPNTECDADVEDETDTPTASKTPVAAPRTTRSKMRLNKPAPPKLPVGSSEDEQPQDAPTRSTRSKMRVNKGAPPKLQSGSSDEENSGEPARTTRSKLRVNKPAVDTHSLKRPPQDMTSKLRVNKPAVDTQRLLQDVLNIEPSSPPKRQCVDGSESQDSDDVVYKTPSPPCPKNKVIRGQAHLQTTSFLSQLKKTVNTPSNLSTTITSFIKRNTPMKSTVQKINSWRSKDREMQKRKEVEAKKEATEQRLNKRQEMLQQRAEEQRRRREERQALAAQRREENQKRTQESRNDMQQKQEEKKDLKARMQEERLKEERERQKLREKKLAVAEMKRKQEEEARLEKLQAAEAEAKRQEEALQRKREYEEAERQKRIVEQRRLEEERREEAVKERKREMERIHLESVEKAKKDAEERKLREDELKRERQEREKRELEDKRERENVRMAELDKIREKERLRLISESAAATAQREEEKKAREAIQKHNSVLKQNTSLMNASNTSITQGAAKPALNTTITKEPVVESYEMTPTKKYTKNKNNPQNYDINDLHSDDSTDDEEAPRRPTPAWATGSNLKAAMINQHYHPPDLDTIFPMIQMPDLNLVFKRKKPRFNKRTSSACWESPILKHSVPH